MGANQSASHTDHQQGQQQQQPQSTNQQHRILVVNPKPGQERQEAQFVLPPRVAPILTINGLQIDPQLHKLQLNYQLWSDFVRTIHEFANSRANLVAARQDQLEHKIVLVDKHVQMFTDSYVNDKHKALARMNDDCKRVEEINILLHKCTIQAEVCVNMLNKLNFLLPKEQKLEPLVADENEPLTEVAEQIH